MSVQVVDIAALAQIGGRLGEDTAVSGMTFCHVAEGAFIYGPELCFERLELCPPFKPRQTISLPAFWLAQTPVNYAQWRQFLDETGHDWVGQWYEVVGGWRGKLVRAYAPTASYPAKHADWPIVDVTQADAYAFCGWLSQKLGRPVVLPTEVEWE